MNKSLIGSAMAVAAATIASMGGRVISREAGEALTLSTQDFADAVVYGAKRMKPHVQSSDSNKFRQDRAKAKRERRYETPLQFASLPLTFERKTSRQVERAQFRKEVKQGKRYRMLRERESRLIGRSEVAPSTLRIAAMNAVSRLSRVDIKKVA